MTLSDIDADLVVEVLLRTLRTASGAPEVSGADRLEDLGIDSLRLADVVVDVEVEIGLQIPLEMIDAVSEVETVDQLLLLIRQALGPLTTTTSEPSHPG